MLLVGGGSILVDCSMPLRGASRVIPPSSHGVREPTFHVVAFIPPWDVANASRGNARAFYMWQFCCCFVIFVCSVNHLIGSPGCGECGWSSLGDSWGHL